MQTTSDDANIERLFLSNFGVSSDQFRRELKAEFQKASPLEKAEFERLVDEANAVLPGMQVSIERMNENVAAMSSTIGEMKESIAALDARVSGIEDRLDRMTAGKPLPFRGGVGVGAVHASIDTVMNAHKPHSNPSPEGEGLR